jgi:hypothetical protein
MITTRDRIRIRTVGILTLAGTPSYWWCLWRHICMDGHLAHGPYPFHHWVNDYWYMVCFTLVGVLSWRMNAKARGLFGVGGLLLLFLRVCAQSGGGLTAVIELPLLTAMDFCSILYIVLPKGFQRQTIQADGLLGTSC